MKTELSKMADQNTGMYQVAVIAVTGLFTLINALILVVVKKYMKEWDEKHDRLFDAVMAVDKKCQEIVSNANAYVHQFLNESNEILIMQEILNIYLQNVKFV